MVRRKGKCPERSRLESLVRAKLPVRLSPLSTLSTKFGSITFCFSLWAAASTVTKKMLIPDSLASLEASSTRSVGHPSTITTTTFGAPPRFPLASKKKFLLTNESAFPVIEEELRRSYGSGSTLSDNIPWNNRQRADSSVGGCRELGKAVSVAVWAVGEATAPGASASWAPLHWTPSLCPREAAGDELG